MPKPVNNRWRNLTGRDLLERYGMTEFGMGLSQPLNTELRVGVGKPMIWFITNKTNVKAASEPD